MKFFDRFFSIFKIGLSTFCVVAFVACDSDDTDAVVEDEMSTDGEMEMVAEPVEPGRRSELYITNNENGNITKYSVTGDSTIVFTTPSTAAEGIFYDKEADEIVQASRSANRLESYSETSTLLVDTSISVALNGSADLESPREIAVSGDKYVVSSNVENKFFIYQKTGSSFDLLTTVDVPFPVWGITFKGTDLYAVVDTTSDLAVYLDFLANAVDGVMTPSKRILVEGIVRTHGLTYDGTDDVMIMTDIGDAGNTTDDGGFHIINDFSTKFDLLSDGEVLPIGMQIRVAGAATGMGNPTDVAYDSETDAVYVSDIGTGKVLGFTNIGAGGDLSPSLNLDINAASSLYFSSDETDGNVGTQSATGTTNVYATSTADGNILVFNPNDGSAQTYTSASTSSEGIFFSALTDVVIQASRSNLMVEAYGEFSGNADGSTISPSYASGADLASPREIAVFGNKVVVSDNGEDKFFVYTYDGTAFTLQNTIDVGFNLWGIAFMGNDLLAVVDNSSDLVIFSDFFTNDPNLGDISVAKRITIEGIVRTHGITYNSTDNVLVMTDIGDAANTTDDGAIHVIANFTSVLAATADNGSIALADQKRIAGSNTTLGNPIDVAYDHVNKRVYVSEIGNGTVLGFGNILQAEGNVVPYWTNGLVGSSSVYVYNN